MSSAQPLRVASFDPGAITRDTINAHARSRSRPAGPSSAGSPSALACAQTAATCPCGSDLVIVAAAEAGTNGSPFKEPEITSINSAGK